MFCFPGGGIEAEETEQVALRRELIEELDLEIQPVRRLWKSVSSRKVSLAWWLADMDESDSVSPNPEEVQSVHWYTVDQMRRLNALLDSNREFLDALVAGRFTLKT